jgi:hypothetical protein
MLALFSLATVLLRKNRDLAAGALVGLAFFKFQIVIPIAFLFLVWRRWRVFGGICLSAGFAITASCLLVGLSGMQCYFRLLISMSGDAAHYQYGLTTIAMPNLRGLISALLEGAVPARVTQAITLFISILLMVWVGVSGQKFSRGRDALPIAITAAALVSYHILIQDLSMLLIPVSLTLERCIRANAWNQLADRLRCYAAASVPVVVALAFLYTRYLCIAALTVTFLLITMVRGGIEVESDGGEMHAIPAGV